MARSGDLRPEPTLLDCARRPCLRVEHAELRFRKSVYIDDAACRPERQAISRTSRPHNKHFRFSGSALIGLRTTARDVISGHHEVPKCSSLGNVNSSCRVATRERTHSTYIAESFVRRRFYSVLGIICLLGISSLLPWNVLITQAEYLFVRAHQQPTNHWAADQIVTLVANSYLFM